MNGFSLGLAACLKRHPAAVAELPESFKHLDLSSTQFRLILVICGHKMDWLPPLKDALTKSLSTLIKTWALTAKAVAVLNEELAIKHGLITTPVANKSHCL